MKHKISGHSRGMVVADVHVIPYVYCHHGAHDDDLAEGLAGRVCSLLIIIPHGPELFENTLYDRHSDFRETPIGTWGGLPALLVVILGSYDWCIPCLHYEAFLQHYSSTCEACTNVYNPVTAQPRVHSPHFIHNRCWFIHITHVDAIEKAQSTNNRRNYIDKELINDMIVPLLHQWTKANALFKPPVINQCRTIELKLTKLWHKAVETSLGKGNLARKNEFLHTLDTLFDILTCKCSIQLCSESNCSHSGKRENNSHIDCGCPREKKIPVLELEFIKAQRTKAEGQGSMQMGSIDYSETKKQIANAKKREQIREREQKKKMKSEEAIQREEELCQDVYHFFDSSSDEQEATSDDIPPINVNATKLSELVDLSLEVLEPPLTTSLTSQELRNLKETPMQVPKWPSHTQSVERCVKMVTEAAGHVYSHERRE
ncbi:hypothetical protein Hamer_G007119, partial [Homarus americanus]